MSVDRCTLETPLRELASLTPQRIRQLERFGLEKVGDLLTHYPRRHEDRTRFERFPDGENPEPVCVYGIVKKTQLRRLRGRLKMFDAVLEEENPHALSSPLICRWFNAHWVEKAIIAGQRLIIHGRPKRSAGNVVISHPEFEVVEVDAETSIHLERIVPVHAATEGLSARVLRQIIWEVLQQLDVATVDTLLPPSLDRQSRALALQQIHFPDNHETLAQARRHLVLEEFFALQLSVAAKRTEQRAMPGAAHCGPGELMARLHALLPFPLTGAQTRAIAEIRADLAAPRAMNRLLHGDVGSGKTLVALSAMLLAVEAGDQAAIMAPTQILAEQHYFNLRRLCDPLGIRVALRTGARREESGALPLFETATNQSGPGGARDSRAALGVPPSAPGARYSRGRLPHFERPWATYFITFNTIDPRKLNASERDIVLSAATHWNDRRYELFAACVMPDHVHLLIQPQVKESAADGSPIFYSLTEILHSLKSWSAHEVNKLSEETGALWQKEWFDRLIRSDADLQEKYHYILANPWTARVVDEAMPYSWCWYPGCGLDSEAARNDFLAASRREAHAGRVLHPIAAAPAPPLPDSEPHLLVGTHALLYEGAGFTRLGLAVIDEQHKFGVLQRARLRDQGTAPDMLVMTATPIPRTLTMTLYGDLDISTLDEMPKGRGKIVTAVRAASKLPEAAAFIRDHLAAGRQAYVVYPLIDESDALSAKAAATEFAQWKERLAPRSCELLHGRIAPEDKEATMDRFRRGETKALIATTVIEVGVDVPNANIMLIENAERFGLAQLHQLRGRIGRGEHKSYCILLTGPKADQDAIEKLRILEQTSDGFEIAEADLRMRGPGDLLGTAQSGLPPLKIGDVFADAELMKLARNAAFLLFERDPELADPANARFRKLLASARASALSQVS